MLPYPNLRRWDRLHAYTRLWLRVAGEECCALCCGLIPPFGHSQSRTGSLCFPPFSLHSFIHSLIQLVFLAAAGLSGRQCSRRPGRSGRSPSSDTPSIFISESPKHRVTKNCPRGVVGWHTLCPKVRNPHCKSTKDFLKAHILWSIIKTSELFPCLQTLAETSHGLRWQ